MLLFAMASTLALSPGLLGAHAQESSTTLSLGVVNGAPVAPTIVSSVVVGDTATIDLTGITDPNDDRLIINFMTAGSGYTSPAGAAGFAEIFTNHVGFMLSPSPNAYDVNFDATELMFDVALTAELGTYVIPYTATETHDDGTTPRATTGEIHLTVTAPTLTAQPVSAAVTAPDDAILDFAGAISDGGSSEFADFGVTFTFDTPLPNTVLPRTGFTGPDNNGVYTVIPSGGSVTFNTANVAEDTAITGTYRVTEGARSAESTISISIVTVGSSETPNLAPTAVPIIRLGNVGEAITIDFKDYIADPPAPRTDPQGHFTADGDLTVRFTFTGSDGTGYAVTGADAVSGSQATFQALAPTQTVTITKLASAPSNTPDPQMFTYTVTDTGNADRENPLSAESTITLQFGPPLFSTGPLAFNVPIDPPSYDNPDLAWFHQLSRDEVKALITMDPPITDEGVLGLTPSAINLLGGTYGSPRLLADTDDNGDPTGTWTFGFFASTDFITYTDPRALGTNVPNAGNSEAFTYSVSNGNSVAQNTLTVTFVEPEPTCSSDVSASALNFGTVAPGEVSDQQTVTISNAGTSALTTMISGDAWKDGSDANQMLVGATAYSTISGRDHSDMTPLSDSPAGSVATAASSTSDLYLRVMLDLINPGFKGAMTQTITLSSTCS